MNTRFLSLPMIAALVCAAPSSHGAELLVTSPLDSGPGTLRQQIADAQPGDTITFTVFLDGGEIELTSDQISISKELHIDASALSSGVSIARLFSAPRFRHFEIDDSNPATKLSISITGVTFTGGISPLGGSILNSEDLELTDCRFVENRATGVFPDGRGGAILNQSGAIATLTRVDFEENNARTQGGAICNLSSSGMLSNCSFIENSSLADAGAMFNEDSSPALLNCTFLGNEAESFGGAVLNISGSSPGFTNCSFSLNRSTSEIGGGSAVFNLNASNPSLLNCTIAGNTVIDEDLGGTIYNAGSSPVLTNCILWGNDDGIQGSAIDASSSLNLIEGQPGSQDPIFVRDPGTSDPDDYGDLRLRSASPAVDSGDGGPGLSLNDSVEDLMGQPRFVGSGIDMGAYEGGNQIDFAFFYGGLDPNGDANHNGLSNFIDYASGADPQALADPLVNPSLSGQQVSFSYRTDADDVLPSFHKSTDLVAWNPLVQGTDYTSSSSVTVGPRTIITFNLVAPAPPNDRAFFRTDFATPAP